MGLFFFSYFLYQYKIILSIFIWITKSWELIHNKGYQKFDSVSSVVTTKVKGQGFVPINAKLPKFNRTHPLEYFRELFTLRQNVNYKILDTAGNWKYSNHLDSN